jgi:pimeloyl-ACP methyl ester carboxylesterase
MMIVFIPGFSRTAGLLANWKTLLPDADVRFVDIPGQGREPRLETPSLEAIAERYMTLIPRDAVLVGESLGGLVALKMAAQGYRAIAVDPPLSTAKLWILHSLLPHVVARNAETAPWFADMVDVFFGVREGEPVKSVNYWPLLDEVASPAQVIAASEPLWPQRQIALTPSNTPSVLDEVDAYTLARHPNVRFRRLPGPHTLLTDAVEATHPALLEILAEISAETGRL